MFDWLFNEMLSLLITHSYSYCRHGFWKKFFDKGSNLLALFCVWVRSFWVACSASQLTTICFFWASQSICSIEICVAKCHQHLVSVRASFGFFRCQNLCKFLRQIPNVLIKNREQRGDASLCSDALYASGQCGSIVSILMFCVFFQFWFARKYVHVHLTMTMTMTMTKQIRICNEIWCTIWNSH